MLHPRVGLRRRPGVRLHLLLNEIPPGTTNPVLLLAPITCTGSDSS